MKNYFYTSQAIVVKIFADLVEIAISIKNGEKKLTKIALVASTGCFTPIGVYTKLATLNPKNIPVIVISIDI